jgi:protein-S-isoprenylcysteine O-methyltransferase Ste14
MKETIRYIAGYLLGLSIFILLIPYGLYKLSLSDCFFAERVLISSSILRYIIASVFFLVGAFFAIWSNIFLFMVGKGGPFDGFGISISPQTKKLVTTGPYRYSRNPMVFGAFSLYISTVVFLNSITGLICLLICLLIAIIYLRLSEEKRLLKDFGDEYKDYRKHVSMIFPIKRMKM